MTLRNCILALALCAVGCAQQPIYPGDGSLVIVDFDRSLDSCRIRDLSVGDAVRIGTRYWDLMGARFRTVDQITSADEPDKARARHISVEAGACPDPSTSWDQNAIVEVGDYDDGSDYITLDLENWAKTTCPICTLMEWGPSCVAHELGHSMGLQHVPESDALMFWNIAGRWDLSAADAREFRRVWPAKN